MNLSWKTLKKFLNTLILVSLVFTFSCIENESGKDCGCYSETTRTIPESANLIGKISYKIKTNDNGYYSNRYWIVYIDPNCSNCVHSMIVCNEDILDEEFEVLKNGETYFEVSFAGKLKNVCNRIYSPADYTYEHITLTKIEKQ
ncbi:MAG: hypothetical protein F9K37_14470 [Bacteroidales bacterium]|nr:MAG: hypothetical protein F9K37_14470 [Bacteroidales bacterium]